MEHDVFLKKYTTHLNENQLKAVQTVDGPILLLAVPGSGKTTVLVHDTKTHKASGNER